MGPVGRGRAARSRPGRGGCRRPGRPGEAPPSRGSAARARSQAPGALRQSLQGDRAPFRRPGGSRPVTAHCSLGSPGPTACSPWGASVPRPRLLCPRQRAASPLLSTRSRKGGPRPGAGLLWAEQLRRSRLLLVSAQRRVPPSRGQPQLPVGPAPSLPSVRHTACALRPGPGLVWAPEAPLFLWECRLFWLDD